MSHYYDKLIIDGNNFLFRAFFVKRPDKIVNGINVTPIHQFLSMLKSTANRFKPKEIILTWDKKLNSTKKNFRKDLVAYKEQRVETDKTAQLFSNISHIQKFIDALGIKTIYPVNMEADDVIRYLSLSKDEKILIVSSDKDLLQLINDNVSVYLPNKDIVVDQNNFEEVTSVKKDIFVLYKSILGDVSDNIFGLEKFGPIRAKSLAEKIYSDGSPDFQNSGLTEEQISVINKNLLVIDLQNTEKLCSDEYNFYKDQEENHNLHFNSEKLLDLFKEYNFFNFINSLGEWNNLFNKNIEKSDLLSQLLL